MLETEKGSTVATVEPSLSDYYNASQLRADTWNRLKTVAVRLDKQAGSGQGGGGRPDPKLIKSALEALDMLEPIESYWAFPGHETFQHLRRLLKRDDFHMLSRTISRIVRALMSGSYRRKHIPMGLSPDEDNEDDTAVEEQVPAEHARPYFEVMVVDSVSAHDARSLRAGLGAMRRPEDSFIYESVVVPSFEDGLIGVLFNHNIQAVVIRYGFPMHSRNRLELLQRYLSRLGDTDLDEIPPEDYGIRLAELIGRLRPELDVYLVTDQMVEDVAGRVPGNCRRVFYNQEDYLELHLNILRGVNSRYDTPFFTALKNYSKQPTGVFHAMPISRGKSIVKSNWIRDMGDFYGMNIFLAETSATSGGLDSLLDPHGPIKAAQEKASRAFGSRHTFFATNGTSTCNKIVVQALVQPGDIVLVDRDCHKSHHYGMVLSGAQVV